MSHPRNLCGRQGDDLTAGSAGCFSFQLALPSTFEKSKKMKMIPTKDSPQLDPRRGRISASGIERAALCPGSFAAEKGKVGEVSEIANAGTRIHAALENDEYDKLSEDERILAERAAELRQELIGGFFASEPMLKLGSETLDPELFHKRETRLYAFNERLSGQYDGSIKDGHRSMVYDFKTGYLEPIEATHNLQLRALAVLVQQNDPEITEVTTVIIQPRIRPEISTATYDVTDLKQATAEVQAILDRAYTPDARRHPGPIQCKYCKAKADCPEAAELAVSLSKVDPAGITAERLPELLHACSAAKKIIQAIESKAREILNEDPLMVPGWGLRRGGKMSKVDNPQQLFNRMNERYSVLPHEFVSICDVGSGKLKELLKEVSGLTGKALTEELKSLLVGVVKETEKAASLIKVK